MFLCKKSECGVYIKSWTLRDYFLGLLRNNLVLEDYQRYLSDYTVNHRSAFVVAKTARELADGTILKDYPVLRRIRWQDLQVGHVVYMTTDQAIPADMILLSSSDPEAGAVSVETSQLDGES